MSIDVRIGQGTDIHKIDHTRPLMLGGVEIPSPYGLLGHSDADVLLHAICDALLGALAMDDIGAHFPDTDPAYKDIDSRNLVRAVVEKVHEKGWCVSNLDSTILTEKPKLRPHIETIRSSVAELLAVSPDQVSVKATRGESLGFIGREEGMMAQAVVLIQRQSERPQ